MSATIIDDLEMNMCDEGGDSEHSDSEHFDDSLELDDTDVTEVNNGACDIAPRDNNNNNNSSGSCVKSSVGQCEALKAGQILEEVSESLEASKTSGSAHESHTRLTNERTDHVKPLLIVTEGIDDSHRVKIKLEVKHVTSHAHMKDSRTRHSGRKNLAQHNSAHHTLTRFYASENALCHNYTISALLISCN